MATQPNKPLPIINAHSHIFTANHVPPLLAKKFIPRPLFWLAHLGLFLAIYKFYKKIKGLYYKDWHRRLRRLHYGISFSVRRNWLLRIPVFILGAWLTCLAFYYSYDFINFIYHFLLKLFTSSRGDGTWLGNWIERLRKSLLEFGVLPEKIPLMLKILVVLLVLFFFKSGRNLILYVFKKVFSFFKLLPGEETKKLIERYLLIAKYAVYKRQTDIFSKMKDQYPSGSGFVILPMDMEFMEAGKCKVSYMEQLEELEKVKSSARYKEQGVEIYPFVFIDPRRIRKDDKENDSGSFYDYELLNFSIEDNTVVLKKSIVQKFMETYGFNGFKIYPALGYYPFEKELLPLWKYAADHGIPIMSHCIKGTIFYRGKKKREWDEHWVFREEESKKSLLLAQIKNVDFQLNFSHPMNFLCLLEEPLLRILIEKYDDKALKDLFGYKGPNKAMERNLRNLKVCLAHYGGEDQWKKYLEKDSYDFSQQVNKKPGLGIEFLTYDASGAIEFDRLAKLWKYVDWYSIISSMMMQYPNIYADISYILHDRDIFPLLKETLKVRYGKLRERVLFGTDFYVVRNHNSEKDLFVSSDALLDENEFNLIARVNPNRFLART